ncbi:MAG: electron transfer flavoprotein subunit beta/FixA family protein [Chloroflexi bacterium]|nr:electron transfer flavoprotein subunit beta/FixA family protein [Chloroflexota bacterium]
MDIIVCAKQVIDPEAPSADLKVDPATNKIVPSLGVACVINPYDEQALEAALRLKDAHGGTITVLSLGDNLLGDVMKKALAMGADELVFIEDEALAEGDSWSTASTLAAAIKKIGRYDLVVCGRQSSDTDAGQVGSGIAELLGLPSVTVARKIDIAGGTATVARVLDDGFEVVEVPLPAVITVSNELGEPRYPTVKGILAAKKKAPVVWKRADLPAGDGLVRRTSLVKLFQPSRQVTCVMVEGETPEEVGAGLAVKLREAKVI